MSAVLDAALSYASRGWPVFPCEPAPKPHLRSKAPLLEQGLHDASTDPDIIKGWWRRWPSALIGLPTGRPLGAFVVDLDPRAVSCEELWRQLEEHIGASLGDPVVAVTQSGGWHLYFALPAGDDADGIRNRAGKKSGLVENVDVRGTGGYVIAPPSAMLDGKSYAWRQRRDGHRGLTEAPAELIDAILRRGAFAKAGEPPARRSTPPSAGERARKYALSALDSEVRELRDAPDGTRNDRLNAAAFALGQLVGAGALSESIVIAALEDAASAWPNLKKSRGTIRSGLTAGMAQPRDLREVEAPTDRRDRPSRPPPPSEADAPNGAPSHDGRPGNGDGLSRDILMRCSEFELSDTGNAHRLKAWFGEDLLHVHGLGWHVWDGQRWEFEAGIYGAVERSQETGRRIHAEAAYLALSDRERAQIAELEAILRGEEPASYDDSNVVPLRPDLEVDRRLAETRLKALKELVPRRQQQRSRHAVNSGNASRVRGTLEMAEPLFNVSVDEMDREKLAINVRNGTLRLIDVPDPECPDPDAERTIPAVRLDPHRPADRITKVMNCRYDPDATAPRWEAFLERFLPDPAVRHFVQTYYGYGLTGLTSAQVFLFHYGSGANGKSTFIEALRRLMGDYARVLQAEAVTGEHMARSGAASPEFARLGGARFVQVSELPKGAPLKEETIKLMTGGEPMTVRYLMKDPFELIPEFKASLTGNNKPQATGSDYAVFRRLRLVHWSVRIEECERRPMVEVLAEFEAEAAGILNWLIAGLLRYRSEGLRAPGAVVDATEDYRSDMDPVGEFIHECVQHYDGATVGARQMYEAYILWCEANAMRPYSEKRFASEATAAGLIRSRERIRKYKNVRLGDVPLKSEELNYGPEGGAYQPAGHKM